MKCCGIVILWLCQSYSHSCLLHDKSWLQIISNFWRLFRNCLDLTVAMNMIIFLANPDDEDLVRTLQATKTTENKFERRLIHVGILNCQNCYLKVVPSPPLQPSVNFYVVLYCGTVFVWLWVTLWRRWVKILYCSRQYSTTSSNFMEPHLCVLMFISFYLQTQAQLSTDYQHKYLLNPATTILAKCLWTVKPINNCSTKI